MKKLFLVLLAVGMFASCQKKPTPQAAKTQAVTFGVNIKSPTNLKADPLYDTIQCSDVIPDMAWIQIDGVDYYTHLSTVEGKIYTQSIQLSPGPHTVNQFVLYKETDGTQGPTGSDPIVYGTPESGSTFAAYVTNPLPFDITVKEFAKVQVPVEVLCFDPHVYDSFGYGWFVVDRIVVREQCFFGDFCTKHFMDYAESDYTNQSTGLQLDMPAIFQIKGFEKRGDGDWAALPGGNNGVWTNDTDEAGYGVGAPVCVKYGDKLGVVDSLKFELYILVKQGADFNFVLFHTFLFADDEMIPAGDDGVVDFELGNCNAGGADLQLPPYINLPAQATLKVGNHVPGTLEEPDGTLGYFDITLSGIGTGFDIGNGGYPVHCMERDVNIYLRNTYTMLVESSLYPDAMNSAYAQALPWDEVNWLINHLSSYPGHTWSDIQQALWMLEDANYDGTATGGQYMPAAITSVGLHMVADAHLLGVGFVPGPGDLAAIAFERSPSDASGGYPKDGSPVQIVIIRLDP